MADAAMARIQADPHLKELLASLRGRLDALGSYEMQARKSSLHFVRGTGFLSVRAVAGGLLLTIVSNARIDGARVRSSGQASEHRTHNEVVVSDVNDFDDELDGWLGMAYALAGG